MRAAEAGISTALTVTLGLAIAIPAVSQPTPQTGIFVSDFNGIVPVWQAMSETDFSPDPGGRMIIYEVSKFPDQDPSPEHVRAADELLERARAAVVANGWQDFDKAVADGFELMFEDDNHYVKREFITDGRVLDPERPEFLLYYKTDEGMHLAGLMFLVAEPDQFGPQIGGPLTVWHFHVWSRPVCLWGDLLVWAMPDESGKCEEGTPSQYSPQMLHLWFFDRPEGQFWTGMDLELWQIDQLKDSEF